MTNSTSAPSWLTALFQSTSDSKPWFQVALTLMRVIVSGLMIHNGLDKLANVAGFATNVVDKGMGLPFPVFLTYCSAYAEILGSILLILGLLSRPAAFSLVFTMIMAIYFHLKVDGLKIPAFETASLYAVSFLFFLVNGGGQYSLDALIAKRLGNSE
ncbi:MAG: DoxX family protein [Acaryochloridaceae cyanobacterium SU_2_1]|nr:DoxX family protein [Acaryochloridaceae cyanobacterium SU_2_1]